MKDFVKEYQKRQIFWKISIVLWAFIMAFCINFLILEENNFSQNLKTSIIDSNKIEQKADFYLENENWKIFLKNSKFMQDVKNISFSLVYDSWNLQIDELKSDLSKVELLGEKASWVETIILNFENKNIEKNQKIAEIYFSKKDENKISSINLLNSNFSDSKETFYLTTSGINL